MALQYIHLSSLMIRQSPRLIHPTCGRNQLRSSSFSFTRHYSSHAGSKLGLSLASLLGTVVAGCSWYRLNLDAAQDSSSTRDNARKLRQPAQDEDLTGSVHMHYPRAYMQTSEKTVFPGDHTGVARFDMAHTHSTSYVLLPL